MKTTSNSITLGSKTFTAQSIDYDSYETNKGQITLGFKTYSAQQTVGKESDDNVGA